MYVLPANQSGTVHQLAQPNGLAVSHMGLPTVMDQRGSHPWLVPELFGDDPCCRATGGRPGLSFMIERQLGSCMGAYTIDYGTEGCQSSPDCVMPVAWSCCCCSFQMFNGRLGGMQSVNGHLLPYGWQHLTASNCSCWEPAAVPALAWALHHWQRQAGSGSSA